MEKKIIAAAVTVVFAGSLFIAGRYIKNSGILSGYPDAEYLTAEEAEHKPIYKQLTKDEQAVYTALYRGITKKEEKIPLPMDIDGDEYSRVYCIIEKQESSFFYLDSVYYTAQKVREAKIVYREKNSAAIKESELDAAVDTAVNAADDHWTEYDKVRYINDYLVRKCKYVSGDDSEYASTAYGCLVKGEANCEGYAKAFGLLASELDMDSVVVTGKTDKGENHAWNQVKVDDEWYNLDVTWADSDEEGDVRLMYFMCSDADFAKTHIADRSLFDPYICGSDEKNYYVQNGLYAENCDEAVEIVQRELEKGNGVIEIRFAQKAAYDDFRMNVMENNKIFEVLKDSGYPYDENTVIELIENRQELCQTIDFTKKE